jgi:magnesium-transporting ATPase (P-type)
MQRIDLDQLREAFLQAPESEATRIVAIGVSSLLLIVVLWLVRRRTLREEYTPIWVGVSVAMAVLSFQLGLIRSLTRLVGAWTPSSAIFLLGELFLVIICLNYAVRLSRHGMQIKNLAQEAAILRAKVDSLTDALKAERLGAPSRRTDPSH